MSHICRNYSNILISSEKIAGIKMEGNSPEGGSGTTGTKKARACSVHLEQTGGTKFLKLKKKEECLGGGVRSTEESSQQRRRKREDFL